jgi:hypothetical protein
MGMEKLEKIMPVEKNNVLFEGNDWALPTDIDLVDGAIDEYEGRLTAAGWKDFEFFDYLSASFREALINAIAHGNLGVQKPDDNSAELDELAHKAQKEKPTCKCVFVHMDVTPEKITITVRDEGNGFDWRSLPDPTDKNALLRPSGRGILYMRSFYDEVQFNDAGNEVTLIKRKPKSE